MSHLPLPPITAVFENGQWPHLPPPPLHKGREVVQTMRNSFKNVQKCHYKQHCYGLLTQKHFLQMWCGFSSCQLVYGKKLNLSYIMDNTPALEGSSVSSVFAQNTNVLYSVCQAEQAGSSDRKALQHKI